ncbi:ABC transporter-like protein [Trypanosoma theileri]|uniref:ABC transporter-like protein n=1 Tax=Trypanosoma theileri TaxID=67003 RepID=A0A1X0NU80_9TRYP|nr:ABC transporter-like protein [Trypanosoma theileri]ORC88266.1 ABC transporter-like protein [Trypanosoma theileri]
MISRDVFFFAVQFWRPHVSIMLLSALLMLFSTSLSLAITQIAREVATFNNTAEDIIINDNDHTIIFIATPSAFTQRCIFLAVVILLYHFFSFLAHKTAYQAGQKIHNTILETVLMAVLRTPHVDRISAISPVVLSQIIYSSAKTSADVAGALLTDVLSSIYGAIAIFCVLLHMSITLTLTISAVLVGSQLILRIMRQQQNKRSKELALAESNVQAFTTNALHRNVTIRVFHAEPLILNGIRERLYNLSMINSNVVTSIHGQAGFSSAVTGLVFVLVLGMTNSYHQQGVLDIIDIGMYYLLLYQFINRLQQLQHDIQRTLSLLEGLYTLEQLISWYEVGHLVSQQLTHVKSHSIIKTDKPLITSENSLKESPADKQKGVVICACESSAPILLQNVTYIYPEIPSFFPDMVKSGNQLSSPSGSRQTAETADMNFHYERINGIQDISFTIETGKINILYGPSGSGKSTCLRLLAGLLQPHQGTIYTHEKIALLEQHHAILLGTVADNILMTDIRTLSEDAVTLARRDVNTAMQHSRCHSFLHDPFDVYIHSPEKTQFSGGQLQRICMARLFAKRDSTLFLLDEPTTGLDKESVEHLLHTLKDLHSTYHKTIVVATHDTRMTSIAHNIIRFDGKKENCKND